MVLFISLNGCKENKSLSDNSTIKKEDASLKINASKKDLAEIMLYQDYWKDTVNLSRDVYTRLLYVRSDGTISREQELDGQFDVSWMKTSNDGQYWVYTADTRKNLEVANIIEKTKKKIYDGTENAIGQDGKKIKIHTSFDQFEIFKNMFVYSTGFDNITRYNLNTGQKDFVNLKNTCFWPLAKSETACYYFGFLPNSKDDEVEGKPKRAIYHFDFNTKKETLKKVLPFKFRADNRAISENAEVAIFKMENKIKGEDGWDEYVNDSLYFYLNDFTERFSIAIEDNVNLLHIGPLGKWIYFRDDNAVYRISIIKLRERSIWNEKELIKSSECVYVKDRFIKTFKLQNIYSINE